MPLAEGWRLWLATIGFILMAPMNAAQEVPLAPETIKRMRLREAGIVIGTLPPGPLNALTDVEGVKVGHTTLREGDTLRTGVTAIFPHAGDLFRDRVPAAIHVGNGFGKLLGVTQVEELGELETPILLTGTLGVWRVADALATWMLARPGMENVRSLNPVVGETNDGFLSDIRARPLTPEHVFRALEQAAPGPVAEGAVGAGTGTVAFGWKGGIGTSSRRLPESQGGYTVGVLVQSNYGGDLTLAGVPVGRKLREQDASPAPDAPVPSTPPPAPSTSQPSSGSQDGSIMIIVATDAPMGARSLSRLASRALVGLARTGSNLANGSGDYVIAFSTHPDARRPLNKRVHEVKELANDQQTPLFQSAAEATEEAIGNSLFMAAATRGAHGSVEALPLERVRALFPRNGP